MSGFVGKTGQYDLTATKALYWHRNRSDSCKSLWDVVEAHVWDAGFTVEDNGNYARISGPGLVDGWTDFLFLAISGVSLPAEVPGRRWS